ncbi:M21D2 protein, partial [Acromyrmex insinuator]
MGIVQSLIDSFNHKSDSQSGNTNNNGSKPKNAAKVEEYEDVELIQMKMAITNDPNSFILNNLMMCIQFFENYEEDIIQIKETLVPTYESELNKVLPSQKHVLLPDILQEHISHNIAFTSKRQTGDLIIESLHPIRIYIVHDNIEITERHYLSEYSSLNNGITYNMMVQPSENPGYVRLRRLDETPYASNSCKEEDIDPSLTVDDDEIYDGDGESIYGRNSNMTHHTRITPHHSRKRGLQTSSIFSVKSLPNLHDKTIYEDQVSLSVKSIYETRPSRNFKTESDFEHRSSTENRRSHGQKIWLKNELEVRKESYQRYSQSGVAKQKVCRPASITSSGYRSEACDSDSDWSYQPPSKSSLQTTRNVNHNKNTADASTKIYSDAMIPTQCFKKMRINNDGKIYMLQRERKPQNCKQFRLMLADRQYDSYVFYTSSKVFMNYFVDLFVDQLAEPLGFKREDLNHVEESIIYCDKVIDSHNLRLRRLESYEISPTIWLQWPEYAQEWLDRSRSTWPDYNDINKVKDFGCYVVPEDSLPRKRNLLSKELSWQQNANNIHQEIEWQLAFPAAERYLETCMTRSQVQVYLIALMLHKTFLRQVQDSTTGLTTSHIRNKLFWLIEENDRPFKWPDNRTGDCLIKLLDSLYRCLSQNEPTLLDYFLRDKNVFNKVPANLLLHSQKQLKRIIENPVMYVFHAMENIKYSNKFFPRLNFTKLFNILTVKPWLAMNPALDMYLSPSKSDESYRDEIYNKSGGFWNKARKKNLRNYSAPIAAPIVRKTLITPRKATDCIVEISERCAKLEGIRLAALLDFFVTHFVKMAECCHRYRAYQQKEVYLDQADRLSIILSEMTRYKDDAKAYRKKIYALRIKPTMNSMIRSQNEPPETPERNQKPIFSSTLKDRFTRQFDEVIKLPKDEQPQSSHQDHKNKITKTITSEIGLTNEGNAQANPASAITSEDESPYTSRKPISKDQGDDSTSKTIQKVVSLADNLNETTFI